MIINLGRGCGSAVNYLLGMQKVLSPVLNIPSKKIQRIHDVKDLYSRPGRARLVLTNLDEPMAILIIRQVYIYSDSCYCSITKNLSFNYSTVTHPPLTAYPHFLTN